jgi:hypothetical protein
MAAHFNPIALRLPLSRELQCQLDSLLVGRVDLVVTCPQCEAQYHIIAPATIGRDELQQYSTNLRKWFASNCGSHAPVVQLQ